MGKINLNDLRRHIKKNINDNVTHDSNNIAHDSNNVMVYFENIEERLIELIDSASYCVGCVAWLTNIKILEKLQEKKGVKIIIQKEPYIKRDFNNNIRHNTYYIHLRKLYKSIPNLLDFTNGSNSNSLTHNFQIASIPNYDKIENKRKDFSKKKTFKKILNTMRNDDEYAIRCCGMVSLIYKFKPLMHHKFLIMLNKKFKPIGVWTGSYNFTNNGNNSFENAIYITDKKIIGHYIDEFITIYGLSEKINWKYCYLDITNHSY